MHLRKRKSEEGGHRHLLENLKSNRRMSQKQLQKRPSLLVQQNLNPNPNQTLRMQNRSPRNDEVDRRLLSLLTNLGGIRIVVNLQRKSPERILRQKQPLKRCKHRKQTLKTLHQRNDEVGHLHLLVNLKSNQQNPNRIPRIQHRRSDGADHPLSNRLLTRVKNLRGRSLTKRHQKPADDGGETDVNRKIWKSLARRTRNLNQMIQKPAQHQSLEKEVVQLRGLFKLSRSLKNLSSLSRNLSRNLNKLNLLGQMTHKLRSRQNDLHERNALPAAKPSQ